MTSVISGGGVSSLSVPKKSESADVEESKQEREGTNEEEPPLPVNPTPVDKKPTVKSPKVIHRYAASHLSLSVILRSSEATGCVGHHHCSVCNPVEI